MTNFLVISIIATDAPGLARGFSELTSRHNCNIEDSHMAIMGKEFSISMIISGTTDAIASCQRDFEADAEQSGHMIMFKQTEENPGANTCVPYAIQTLSLDSPGTIKNVTEFMRQRDINISNLVTNSYKAPHTGAPMLEIQLTANIPHIIPISKLRDEFADFCDELLIDAAFEPLK